MNWIIDEIGRARFSDPSGQWRIGSEPARPEAGLWIDRGPEGSAGDVVAPSVRLLPPPGQEFPPLAEAYSRGSDLIASLPQTRDTEFGLNLSHRVLRTTPELVVCETVVAIQTDLLDSHPTLDLVADAHGRPLQLGAAAGRSEESAEGSGVLIHAAHGQRETPPPPAATRLDEPGRSGVCVILLPPTDRAVAEDRGPSAPNVGTPPVCYRLLAEFLEKGVIRKARYWTCRWADEPSDAAVAELYHELQHVPLPLTP